MKITITGSGDGEQYSQFYNIQKKKKCMKCKDTGMNVPSSRKLKKKKKVTENVCSGEQILDLSQTSN